MGDLIEALQIFMKYGNPRNPFCAEHDVLIVCGIEPEQVSEEDKARLHELGFFVGNEFGGGDSFTSYRFGSA